MNHAVFTFVKPSDNSTVASTRIARFLAKELDAPLMWNGDIQLETWHTLFIVNGAFAFCGYLEALAPAIRHAERVVWVQNDYTINPPGAVSKAESPFRKAFRIRHERGLPPTDFWTTVKANAHKTDGSFYVNWNSLTSLKKPLRIQRKKKDLFYYGAFRANRTAAFDRFFGEQRIPLTISSTSKKFTERYDHAKIFGGIPRDQFYEELNGHGLGLYIEDKKSHDEFHSPANRFYEMLSSGLPMVFEPGSRTMLLEAGYDVNEYIVRHQKDAQRLMKDRETIGEQQRRDWWSAFRSDLRDRVRYVIKRYGKL